MSEPLGPLTVDAPPARKARLNVVESVYWQRGHEQPLDVPCRFGRDLASPERPYVRECLAGEAWHAVDLGWAGPTPALLVLVNAGAAPLVLCLLPPEEEAKYRTAFSPPAAAPWPALVVPPGESQRLTPAPGARLLARGAGAYTVHAFAG